MTTITEVRSFVLFYRQHLLCSNMSKIKSAPELLASVVNETKPLKLQKHY